MPGDTCVFCGNSCQKDPSVSIHRFPKDPTLRSEWIKALELDASTIKDHHRVCSRHFPQGDTKNKPSILLGKRFASPKKSWTSRAKRAKSREDCEAERSLFGELSSSNSRLRVKQTESAPVEFSTDQKMETAFAKLLKQFVREFSRPPPYGPSLGEVKVLCINYCESHHHETCDFTTSVSSMDDLFSKLANPLYCNFLNLGLLEYLAESVDNECLKTSIRNYNDTFCNVEIKNELHNMVDYKVKAIRSRFRTRKYEMMFIKLIKKGITYGQVKQIKVKISHKVIFISPNSLIVKWFRKGCICLGWLIPSCLVDAAYHSACTNTAVFAQLEIKYLIIGNYKIEPPVCTNVEVLEEPMELFCKHYKNLVEELQPAKLCEYMFSKGLLNKRDYTVIVNAPCDRIRNSMIIENVRHQSSSYLFTFLDVLLKTDQRYLYDILISALQFGSFLKLPDDYDIALGDEYKDNDSQIKCSFHPCVDQYVKSCLKMNLSIRKKLQPMPVQKESKSPDINIQYLCLIDDLCKLMESCDPGVFIDKCATLMASYIHNIPLFSNEILKDFREYHNTSSLLKYLMCYFTWCDLSIVLKLLEICDYPDGVRLLQHFKHQIDLTKPITEYPIFSPDSLVIPSESSPFTVMTIHYELEHPSLSLKHVEMLKSLVTENCKITFMSCQFLCISNNNLEVFHWLIPNSVLMMCEIVKGFSYLCNNGVKKLIYPILAAEMSNYSDDEERYQEEMNLNEETDELKSQVDELSSQVDTVSKQSNKELVEKYRELGHKRKHDTAILIYQQDLDEIKLKCNLLYKENIELKSQLDTVQNRKLVEKYRELEKHDTVTLEYQQQLLELKLKYNLLYEEKTELKSQLDTVLMQSNKKLIEKYKELKDKEKHDTVILAYQQELDEMQLKYNLICEENTELKSQLDTMQGKLTEYTDKKEQDILYESEKEISIEEDESLIRAQEDELVARKYAAYPELHSDHHDNAVWLDNVPPQVLSKLSKSERDRQAIIYELVKTENQILVAIQILLIVFKKMFQEELKLPEEIVEQMFPHLEPLLALTQEFYYKLKQRLDEARNHVVDHIGDILLEHFTADEGYKVAKVYGAFCSRLRHALDVYQEQNKNKKFKKTVKLFANMQVCQGRSYPEFITLLAQRITEYPHLIAQLCKNTDSKHRDAKGLELALTHSVKVNQIVKESKMQSYHEKLLDIQTNLKVHPPRWVNEAFRKELKSLNLMAYGRQMIKLGTAKWVGSQHSQVLPVLIVLVTDMLVILVERDQKYSLATLQDRKPPVIRLYDLIVRVNEASAKSAVCELFLLEGGGRPEFYTIQFINEEELMEWKRAIQTQIEYCKQNNLKCKHFGQFINN